MSQKMKGADLLRSFHRVYDRVLDCRVSHGEGHVAMRPLGEVEQVLHILNTSCRAKTQEGVQRNSHGEKTRIPFVPW